MHTKKIIEELCTGPLFPQPTIQPLLSELKNMCKLALQPTKPLTARESAAVAFDKPKTAALCFDRVWKAFGSVPNDVAFGGCTEFEKRFFITNFFLEAIEKTLELVATKPNPEETPYKEFKLFEKKCLEMIRLAGFVNCIYPDPNVFPNINKLTRFMSTYFSNLEAVPVTPVYSGQNAFDCEYQAGDRQIVVSVLSNLKIVDEKHLDWTQIEEFRKDKEARKKYRRLMHWLNSQMIGKSASYVEDEIAIRLEDYSWSIKKHGLRTVTGAISSVLDSKFIAAGTAVTAAVSLATDPLYGLLSGAGLIIGQVGVKLANIAIDFEDVKRGSNREVAFIYEAGRKLGNPVRIAN